ncbi:helix-turn-helix domain-containing protein [Gemmiger formicilis]|nr:helix-turn-helix domain-containing protein [Gemmiger formicilis]
MTDTKALRKAIKASGLTYKAIAQALGIAAYTLQMKIDNDTEFKVSEVEKISQMLGFTLEQKDAIFLHDSGIILHYLALSRSI